MVVYKNLRIHKAFLLIILTMLVMAVACGGPTAKMGNTVSIYFEGFVDGVQFPGGTGDFDLRLGSGQFIPGFEEQLVGVKKGEVREVRVRFPEQYAEELAGKDALFRVTVKEIK